MLKYFSSVVEKPIRTGGGKLIEDMQKTIKNFLASEKISYQEYNFGNYRNSLLHLTLPSPYAKYLIFGFLGNPFLTWPLVIPYCFVFCFVKLKKTIAREKFILIVVDLLEWQSPLWLNKNISMRARVEKIFQCFLERILISNIADEIVSLVDNEFMKKNYHGKKIHDLELIDYITSSSASGMKTKSPRVLYAGDLSTRRGFDIGLLDKILGNLNSPYELWVAARGLEESLEIRLGKFQNFRFLGQLDAEQLDNIAKECQFGLILYSPEYLYYNILPSAKLSFYIANGLTVISTNLKRTIELNDKYDFGYTLNLEELLQFIRNLSTNKMKRNTKLEEQITHGEFLHNVLAKMNLS